MSKATLLTCVTIIGVFSVGFVLFILNKSSTICTENHEKNNAPLLNVSDICMNYITNTNTTPATFITPTQQCICDKNEQNPEENCTCNTNMTETAFKFYQDLKLPPYKAIKWNKEYPCFTGKYSNQIGKLVLRRSFNYQTYICQSVFDSKIYEDTGFYLMISNKNH